MATRLATHDIDKDIMRRLVAHRGFHSINDRTDRRPIENSLEAYELAWTSGVVLCECDVAVTRDGKLVLGHDADYCELTTLDAAGSAVFGSLFSGVEAWVCQDSEATSLQKIELQQKHERRSLMHQGQMVAVFCGSANPGSCLDRRTLSLMPTRSCTT